tara:strand:+ start:1565 stop:2743 length:1179 start_codon:yes stop_codon:yes gene_type:complete
VRIAHISDFHLRHHLPGNSLAYKRRGRAVGDLLAAAIEEINGLAPDLLAVTGDLIDYPLRRLDDPETGRLGLEDLQLVKNLLSKANCPVAHLYGNHDHPEHFQDLFGDEPLERDIRGYRVVTFLDEEGEGNHPERKDPERARFDQVLADPDTRPQIHLQHYLVWPRQVTGYPHSYRDAPALKNAIVASGRVRLILSGHYHRGYNLFEEEGVWFSTATAFCEFPHAFRTYDLTDTTVTERVHTLEDRMKRKPAVFIDHDRLLAGLSNSVTGTRALRRLSEAGYLLVATIFGDGASRGAVEIEATSDELFATLDRQDIEVDGLICRFDQEQDVAELLSDVSHAIRISSAHSHFFTLDEEEAGRARDAGIPNTHTVAPTVEDFARRALEICGVRP